MKKILIIGLSIIAFIILSFCIFYNVNLKAVSDDSTEIKFQVDSGSTYNDVINKLKKENLIRNEFCFKLYIKFNKANDLQAGTYILKKNMSVKDIVDVFSLGNTYNPDAVVITFIEGLNMRKIASIIAKNTNNTEDDVYNLLKDTEYLNTLINDYWFIDESILNTNIYYSLEGYLYPETYEFKNKDVTVKEIFKVMLDQMNKELSTYKTDIVSSKYSVHEILTLASIVELEGGSSDSQAGIAGVFYNRLNSNMPLGSDVTTYYAAKVDMSERDLYDYEINSSNAYNTRSYSLAGKLPVGPISNPGIESIKAALYPESNDYYYFVSDKNGKIYFSKTNTEHNQTVAELKKEGLWYTYD